MVNRALFTDLYAPGLNKVFFESYTYRPSEYDILFNVLSADYRDVTDYKMAGFGTVMTKPEGASIVYDDPVPGATVKYEWTGFGKGVRITHEAQRDDRYGQMRKMVSSLGRAFRNMVEIQGMKLLNEGFTVSTGAQGGFHGQTLFHATHTGLRGITGSNLTAAPADLAVGTLPEALINFEKTTDDSGVPIMLKPKFLVVSPEFYPVAREILGSQFKPYTGTIGTDAFASNEINWLQDANLVLFVSHYIANADDWFLLADKSEHDLNFYWREKTSTDSSDDFDSGDGKFKGYARLGIGYGDWRGAWGSPGV